MPPSLKSSVPPLHCPILNEQADQPDWADLVRVLRRILAGDRGEALLHGLDPTDTAIIRQTLARLERPAI
jgi:hypothetical protein